MSTYAICESYWDKTEKKLSRVARKCERLGNPFIFEVVGEEYRTEKNRYGRKVTHKFILVNLEGTAKVEDWEFIATLEVQSTGNIIRRYNTDIEIPLRFRTSPNICEHCNTIRPRTNLYIIHNVTTGEFKQVGGTCLKLYTDGLSLEYIAAWINGVSELESLNGESPEISDDYGAGYTYYDVRTVICYATAIIKKAGYLSSSDSMPTKNAVRELLYANRDIQSKLNLVNNLRIPKCVPKLKLEDLNISDGEIDAIIDYYNGLDDTSEFIHNVQSMLAKGYINPANVGYLCYLPQGYADHIAREKEKAARATEKHEYFGEEGKRYKDITVKNIREVACFSGCYGMMYIYNIIIDNDVVITWKSSVLLDLSETYSKVDFTVKSHEEYKDVPQTIVTRCKLA